MKSVREEIIYSQGGNQMLKQKTHELPNWNEILCTLPEQHSIAELWLLTECPVGYTDTVPSSWFSHRLNRKTRFLQTFLSKCLNFFWESHILPGNSVLFSMFITLPYCQPAAEMIEQHSTRAVCPLGGPLTGASQEQVLAVNVEQPQIVIVMQVILFPEGAGLSGRLHNVLPDSSASIIWTILNSTTFTHYCLNLRRLEQKIQCSALALS